MDHFVGVRASMPTPEFGLRHWPPVLRTRRCPSPGSRKVPTESNSCPATTRSFFSMHRTTMPGTIIQYPAKLEDKIILSDGRKLSMSDLAEKLGSLHTVDSLELSDGSRTHHELHSMRGPSASSHRFLVRPHPHVRVVHVLGSSWCFVRCSAQRRRYVDRWQFSMRCLLALGFQAKQRIVAACTAFLRHHSFLGVLRIHLHRRTQSRKE